jgi:hypothetical protein
MKERRRDRVRAKYSDALVLTEGRQRKHELEILAEPVFHSSLKRVSDTVVKRLSVPMLVVPAELFMARV